MKSITYPTASTIFLLFFFMAGNSIAQPPDPPGPKDLNLEQLLLMPGELTLGHAKIENECDKCHETDDQSSLCLDCHEEINEDLINSRSFHSHIESKKIEQCRVCHTDHKGGFGEDCQQCHNTGHFYDLQY